MDKYDSRMIIKRDCDRLDILDKPSEGDLRIVEFKLEVAGAIKDFENETKDPADIHLLIAWGQGSFNSSRFSIEEIEHANSFKASPKKVFSGVKHFVHDNK